MYVCLPLCVYVCIVIVVAVTFDLIQVVVISQPTVINRVISQCVRKVWKETGLRAAKHALDFRQNNPVVNLSDNEVCKLPKN